MKEKAYDPAGTNENAPEKGMASVNTFNPEEQPNATNENKQKNINDDEPQEQKNLKEKEH